MSQTKYGLGLEPEEGFLHTGGLVWFEFLASTKGWII